MNRRSNAHGMFVELGLKFRLDVPRRLSHGPVVALVAGILLWQFHEPLGFLRRMRPMTTLAAIAAYADVTRMCALLRGVTQIVGGI